MKRLTSAAVTVLMGIGLAACNQAPAPNPNIDLAKAWVTAGATSRSAAMEMIEQNMADDGLLYRDRYVGFGFQWDNQQGADEGRMIVTDVIKDSPVADILQEGDEFISVGDMPVNAENLGKLPFRGKPGESVAAVISRDGQEMAIEVSRGIVSAPTTKAQMLEWMRALMMRIGVQKNGSSMKRSGRATSSMSGRRPGIPTGQRIAVRVPPSNAHDVQ